jgi:hypothetical protein
VASSGSRCRKSRNVAVAPSRSRSKILKVVDRGA